ncbi:MAG: hypothetical protein BYD32DRAFT_128976 [Podila humilis]|nr:MAG: hypothetical protein BYD32DRAFT_128976 [Podila humilis]
MPCRPFASVQSNPHKAIQIHTIRTMHTPSIHPCKEGESSSLLPFRSRPFPSRCTYPRLSFVLSIHPFSHPLSSFPLLLLFPPPNSPTPFLPSGISNGPSFAYFFPCCIPVFIHLFQPFFAILFRACLELRCFFFVFVFLLFLTFLFFLLDPILDTDLVSSCQSYLHRKNNVTRPSLVYVRFLLCFAFISSPYLVLFSSIKSHSLLPHDPIHSFSNPLKKKKKKKNQIKNSNAVQHHVFFWTNVEHEVHSMPVTPLTSCVRHVRFFGP